MSDKSSVENGSKVSESEGSDLIERFSDPDLMPPAGVCCRDEDEGDDDDKDRIHGTSNHYSRI